MRKYEINMFKNCLVIAILFLSTNILAQKNDSITMTNCKPLKELIDGASNGFKKVTGKFINIKDNDSVFVSTTQLPGAISSVIQKRDTYVGKMYEGLSYAYFDTMYVNTLNMMYDCLSPDEYEVLHLREAGNALAKNFPDIQFRPHEEVDTDDGHDHDAAKAKATRQPAGVAPKKPVTIYMSASHTSGTYSLQVLIHPI